MLLSAHTPDAVVVVAAPEVVVVDPPAVVVVVAPPAVVVVVEPPAAVVVVVVCAFMTEDIHPNKIKSLHEKDILTKVAINLIIIKNFVHGYTFI